MSGACGFAAYCCIPIRLKPGERARPVPISISVVPSGLAGMPPGKSDDGVPLAILSVVFLPMLLLLSGAGRFVRNRVSRATPDRKADHT